MRNRCKGNQGNGNEMKKQIKIEEDGKWKTTVNLNDAGKVIREWGDGDDIEKIQIIKKKPIDIEALKQRKIELEYEIDNWVEQENEEPPFPTIVELQDELLDIKNQLK